MATRTLPCITTYSRTPSCVPRKPQRRWQVVKPASQPRKPVRPVALPQWIMLIVAWLSSSTNDQLEFKYFNFLLRDTRCITSGCPERQARHSMIAENDFCTIRSLVSHSLGLQNYNFPFAGPYLKSHSRYNGDTITLSVYLRRGGLSAAGPGLNESLHLCMEMWR